MKKKLIAMLLIVAMVICIAAGCASKPAESEQPTESEQPKETEKPQESEKPEEPEEPVEDPNAAPEGVKTGGTLLMALGEEPLTLNPDGNYDNGNGYIISNCFNKLLTLDAMSQVVLDMATGYTISDDSLSYTFTIPENVYFHNGEHCTSDDIKFTFEQIMAQEGAASYLIPSLESVECVDDYTVIFHLSEVDAAFLFNLAYRGTYILPRSEYEGKDWLGADAMQTPCGTGPFKFDSWERGSNIKLSRNDNYFRGNGAPYLDGVIFGFSSDSTITQSAFLSGEYDMIASYSDYNAMAADPTVVMEKNIYASRFMIQFNTQRKPFDDVNIRRAIAQGIDRDEMLALGLRESGMLTDNYLSPLFAWAIDESITVPEYDPEAAIAAIEAAGYTKDEDGYYFSLTVVAQNWWDAFYNICTVFQKQMEKIGIKVEQDIIEYAAYEDQVVVNKDFDIAIDGINQGPDVAAIARFVGTDGYYNCFGYSDPEMDALLAESVSYAAFEDRAPVYSKIQALMDRDLPYFPFSEWIGYYAHKDYVMNHPSSEAMYGVLGYGAFDYIWLDK